MIIKTFTVEEQVAVFFTAISLRHVMVYFTTSEQSVRFIVYSLNPVQLEREMTRLQCTVEANFTSKSLLSVPLGATRAMQHYT